MIDVRDQMRPRLCDGRDEADIHRPCLPCNLPREQNTITYFIESQLSINPNQHPKSDLRSFLFLITPSRKFPSQLDFSR